MVMHPHAKYHWPISRQKCYGPDNKILFKKQLFDFEVKDQGTTKVITVRDTQPYGHAHTNYLPMNSFVGFIWIIWPWGQSPTQVIMVRDIPPYGHALTYQLSFTYLERPKCYGPDKKILFKKQLFDLEVKVQGPTRVITVRDIPPYGHEHTNYLSMNSFVGFIWIIYLEVKGQGPMKVITVRDSPPYGHTPTYQLSLTYLERQTSSGLDKLRWEKAEEAEEAEEAEAEEKNQTKTICLPSFEGGT